MKNTLSFPKVRLEQLDIYISKKLTPIYTTLHTKMYSKWVIDINVKSKSIQFLIENGKKNSL